MHGNERDGRLSLALQVLFATLEQTGSGAPEFWQAFWVLLPQLSDEELLRVGLAAGGRGRAHFRAIGRAHP